MLSPWQSMKLRQPTHLPAGSARVSQTGVAPEQPAVAEQTTHFCAVLSHTGVEPPQVMGQPSELPASTAPVPPPLPPPVPPPEVPLMTHLPVEGAHSSPSPHLTNSHKPARPQPLASIDTTSAPARGKNFMASVHRPTSASITPVTGTFSLD